MKELNENSLRLLAYAGPNSTPVELDRYGHDLSEHDEIRAMHLKKLQNVTRYIYENTKPVPVPVGALRKVYNFLTRADNTKSEYPYVHELSKTMLVHLKVIANPKQHAWVRGVAVLELMDTHKEIIDNPDTNAFLGLHCETHVDGMRSIDILPYMRDLYHQLNVCFERTPGHLLMPLQELTTYGLMLPTGVLVPLTGELNFLRAYDLHRTRILKVYRFSEDILRLQTYLKSNSDPYSWFTWFSVVTKSYEIPGIWTGAIIAETLKKICNPEQVALGVLASKAALDYLTSVGQIAETMHPIESCEIPDGLLSSLTELREEHGTGKRWNNYFVQGARNLERVVHSTNINSVALKLPTKFMLDSRTCTISPEMVNSVADYVTEHVCYENEIVLQTLLREGWSGSFEELVVAANSL